MSGYNSTSTNVPKTAAQVFFLGSSAPPPGSVGLAETAMPPCPAANRKTPLLMPCMLCSKQPSIFFFCTFHGRLGQTVCVAVSPAAACKNSSSQIKDRYPAQHGEKDTEKMMRSWWIQFAQSASLAVCVGYSIACLLAFSSVTCRNSCSSFIAGRFLNIHFP